MTTVLRWFSLASSCLLLAGVKLVAVEPAVPVSRIAVEFRGTGLAVPQAPVKILGRAVLDKAGASPVALASLRLTGPSGPLPLQCDECDGTGVPVAAPNHLLDPDDEIVFQADLPAEGTTTYWLSWRAEPSPPAVYPVTSLIGAAMEPAMFQHDMQLWNDRVMMGMRGPARGAVPTQNSIDNWGGGSIVFLELFHQPVIQMNSSWGSIFPRGGVAGSPGADASRWSKPRILASGPVRVGAQSTLDNVRLSAKTGGSATAEHRAWLYENGALACFEEILLLAEDTTELKLNYELELRFGDKPGDRLWCVKAGAPQEYVASEDSIRQAHEKSKIVFSADGFAPWLAGHSEKSGKGWAIFADAGPLLEGEKRTTVAFARTGGVFRFGRALPPLAKGTRLVQRFWLSGWDKMPEPFLPAALSAWIEGGGPGLGAVERVR